jgi:hypothetical protein
LFCEVIEKVREEFKRMRWKEGRAAGAGSVVFHIHNREPSSRGYNPPVMALLGGIRK